MWNMKRTIVLAIGLLLLVSFAVYASVGIKDDGVYEGAATDLNFTTGLQSVGVGATKEIKIIDEGIQYKTVSLTSAQVKALRATPQEIIPAPTGGDHIIEVIACKLILDYHNVNAFTESDDNLVLAYNNGQANCWIGHWFEMTNFIDQSADMMANWSRGTCPEPRTICSIINKNVVLMNIGDGEIAGNAANDNRLNIYIAYREIKGGIGSCTLGY